MLGPRGGPTKERRQKRTPAPSADARLKRTVGVVRSLHDLRGRGEWNLMEYTQGREAPPRKDFEKRPLSRAAAAPPLASVREESGSKKANKSATACPGPGTRTRLPGRTRAWATPRDTKGGEINPPLKGSWEERRGDGDRERGGLYSPPMTSRRWRNGGPSEEWCLTREAANNLAMRLVIMNYRAYFTFWLPSVLFVRPPHHRCLFALSDGSIPFSPTSFSPLLEF